jgi:hypothetical protein
MDRRTQITTGERARERLVTGDAEKQAPEDDKLTSDQMLLGRVGSMSVISTHHHQQRK